MPTTLTIRHVPDDVTEGLRKRAQANRRSLQRELLLIIEQAAAEGRFATAAGEPSPVYGKAGQRTASGARSPGIGRGRLTLEQLWQRARQLGGAMPSESAAIVRADRDARNRR